MSLDYEILEFGLAAAAGLLALIPSGLTFAAWRRTRSPRIFFAMLAFFSFTIRGLILGILFIRGSPEIYHEIAEFGGDIVIITLFVIAFISPSSGSVLEEEE